VGVTSFAALSVGVNRTLMLSALEEICYNGGKRYRTEWLRSITVQTLVMQMLPAGAILASSEAIRSYHNGIGITTLAGVSLIGLAMLGVWGPQNRYVSGM
jgi:hypothetical protein